jgi:hypothetical protein
MEHLNSNTARDICILFLIIVPMSVAAVATVREIIIRRRLRAMLRRMIEQGETINQAFREER